MFWLISIIIYLYLSGVVTYGIFWLVNAYPQTGMIWVVVNSLFWFISIWFMVYQIFK